MTPHDPANPAPLALARALEKGNEVKARVEACADELASANEDVKGRIADGATTLSAGQTLANGEAVEAEILECADELHQVTESLAQGLEAHLQTEAELARMQTALANSQEQERAATWRALHDQLTDLPNRALFDDRLQQGIAIAQRHGLNLAVMFLDLDKFKAINDLHGHAAGDTVLKEVASRLRANARDEDTVCRTGGDEFLCLLMNPQGQDNLRRIAGLVADCIAVPISVGDHQVVVRLSVGIAICPEHGSSPEQLIRHADAAMYRAKVQGSGCEVYTDGDLDHPVHPLPLS